MKFTHKDIDRMIEEAMEPKEPRKGLLQKLLNRKPVEVKPK